MEVPFPIVPQAADHHWILRRACVVVLVAMISVAHVLPAAAQALGEPVTPQWFPNELLNWSPSTDPDAPFNRSSVPLANRSSNPSLNVNAHARLNEGRVMTLSAFNTIPSSAPQGSATTRYFTPTFWQYMEALTFWGGSDRDTRIILPPNGHIIDAAHRNGVPVLGKVFFGYGAEAIRLQRLREFLQKSNGVFPLADKLIEVADYYGFDGWFINQETFGGNSTDAVNFRDFILYFRSRAPHLQIMWYDAMAESGNVSFQNEFNSNNDWYLKYGNSLVAHTMFLNFWWGSQYNDSWRLPNSRTHALNLGLDPYDIYAGIDTEGAGYYENRIDWLNLFPEGQPHRLSLGIYRPEWTFNSSSGFYDFLTRDSRYWVGANGDPSNTATSDAWKGLAHYIPARTPITSVPFATSFNPGVGTNYFIHGQEVMRGEWNNLGLQDILPTWRWIVQSTGAKLAPSLAWGDAYNGGTSLRIAGTLSATNDIKLYQVSLPVSLDTKFQLIYKTGVAGQQSHMQVGLAFEDNPGTPAFFDVGATTTSGWNTNVIDLGAYATRRIAAISLRFAAPSPVPSYSVRIGQISVYNGQVAVAAPPANLVLDQQFNHGWTNYALRLKWDHAPSPVYYYNVFRRTAQGRAWLSATPNNVLFIPKFARIDAEPSAIIEVEAVGKDFGSSAPVQLVFPWIEPQTIELLADDAPGISSFVSSVNWSSGLPPAATNVYVVSGRDLNTPESGGTAFQGGCLILSNNAALRLKGVASGSTVLIGNTPATGLLLDTGVVSDSAGQPQALAGYVSLARGGGIFDSQGTSLTVSARITGSGALTAVNSVSAGTLILSGVNSYSGGTEIDSNLTLRLSGEGTLGVGNLEFTSSSGQGFGTLDLNGTSQAIDNLIGAGGLIVNNAASGTAKLTIGSRNGTGGAFFGEITGGPSGAGSVLLEKTGSGTLTLAGTSNRLGAGLTVSGGTLKISNSVLVAGNGSSAVLAIGTGEFSSGTSTATLDASSDGSLIAKVGTLELGVNKATAGNASWNGTLRLGTNNTVEASSSVLLGGSAGAFPSGIAAVVTTAPGSRTTIITPTLTVGGAKCSATFSAGSGSILSVGTTSARTALGVGDSASYGGNGSYSGNSTANFAAGVFKGHLRRLTIASLNNTASGGQIGSMILGSSPENLLDLRGSGPLLLVGVNSEAGSGTASGTLTIGNLHQDSAIVSTDNSTAVLIAGDARSSGTLNLNGGTLKIATTGRAFSGGAGSSTLSLNGVTLAAGASSSSWIQGLGSVQVRAGGVTFDTAGFDIAIPQVLSSGGAGGLTKTGPGRLTLSAANTYTGSTVVREGTLALSGPGNFANSVSIVLAEAALLDVLGRPDQTLTVGNGRMLRGSGFVLGKVSAVAGSTIHPGDGIGTLTVQNGVTLGGNLVMELNRDQTQNSDRLLCPGGTLTGGGMLTVSNIGPALVAGDVFQLFATPVPGFALVNLPELPAGLQWTNRVALDGTLAVVSPASTTPARLVLKSTESQLEISWPPDHTGWRLQVQTNGFGSGLGSSWFDVPASAATNHVVLPFDPSIGSIFYRLVYP